MRINKVIIILSGTVIVGILMLILFSAQNLTKVTNLNKDNISKIVFRLGSEGEYVETEDQEKINEFIDHLNGFQVRRILRRPIYSGWRYKALFYNEKGKVSEITFREPIHIDNWLYDIVKGEIDYDYLADFIEGLEEEEPSQSND